MNLKRKRILCAALASLLLSFSLTACSQVTPGGEISETASTDSAVITTTLPEVTAGDATETESDYDDPAIKLDHLTVGGADISEYTVVIPATPGSYDQLAADFLVRFIGEATGVTVRQTTDAESAAHMILVGTTAYDTEAVKAARAEVKDDGYAMLVDGGNLYVTGALDRGTLFGVYDFLEKYLGVRMYGGVTYPEKQEMYEIKENLRVDIPSDLRSVYSSPVAFRKTSWTAVNDGWAYFPLWNCYNSSEFKFAAGAVHTIAHLAETGGDLSPNPCLTDENIYQTVLKNVRLELEKYPNAQYVNISQTDGTSHGCQCKNCLAVEAEEGSPSGPWIRFVNRIANDIKDDYPNVLVETLAYTFTEKPPKVTKPAENVAVCLCTSSCCFVHAIDDPDCPRNATFAGYVKGWSEICNHLRIWTYSGNFQAVDNGDKNGFAPNFRVIRQTVKFFADHNVTAVYVEGQQHPEDRQSTAMGELRAYLWGRVLWNPDMTEEEFAEYTNDYMNYYYGDAGPLLLKYVDTVYGDMLDNTKYNKLMEGHSYVICEYVRFFRIYDTEGNCTSAYMDKLADIWNEICALDTLTETQKYHVDCAAVQFYDIATSVYNTIASKTRDSEVRQKVRDYKVKLRDAKERVGL